MSTDPSSAAVTPAPSPRLRTLATELTRQLASRPVRVQVIELAGASAVIEGAHLMYPPVAWLVGGLYAMWRAAEIQVRGASASDAVSGDRPAVSAAADG